MYIDIYYIFVKQFFPRGFQRKLCILAIIRWYSSSIGEKPLYIISREKVKKKLIFNNRILIKSTNYRGGAGQRYKMFDFLGAGMYDDKN